MAYISEFTNDVRHIHGEHNLFVNALPRIEINNLHKFQEGLNYNEIPHAQLEDQLILKLLEILRIQI